VYSKQLTLIYDKPLIYFPLSILMLGGIKDILIISNEETIPMYKKLFNDGSHLGLNIQYKLQSAPNGIAESFILGDKFIGDDSVTLILGDNIFYGTLDYMYNAIKNNVGATVFGYRVTDPERYGIVEFDDEGNAISLEEKPAHPKSNYAVPGLYFYDNSVVDVAKNIAPSARGEYEITDVNRYYLEQGKLKVAVLSRGIAWLDTGTFESLLQAAQFVEVIENRQGFKIGCIEEVAYRMKFITREKLIEIAQPLVKSGYGQYLINMAEDSK